MTIRLRHALGCALLASGLAGCASDPAVKSVEMLDERTGMTIAGMPQPMAFVESGIYDLLAPEKQPTVLYIGPVEWDRTGYFSYSLWIQIAPGVGAHRFDDLRTPGELEMELDDGPVTLTALPAPVAAGSPYPPIEPVGQTAYFAADVALLKRMAATQKISLRVRASDLTIVVFTARQDTQPLMQQFMADRAVVDP
jgi:hypothetical protein